MKILMLSTDKKIFEPGSEVKLRMLGYASQVDELFIVILGITRSLKAEENLEYMGMTRLRALFWKPKNKFDLVTSQDPFEAGIIAWRLARHLQTKLELQIHTDISSPYFWRESILNKIRFLIAKFLLSKADQIRVVSQRIADYLKAKSYNPKAKIEVRPIFVDVGMIKNAPITVDLHKKYSQFDKIILMASRLTREKNIKLAIRAMREIVRQEPRAGLIIVGSGSEGEKLRRKVGVPIEASGLKAKSYQLLGNIIFENWVGQEILYSYYKTADLFLNTSWYEGYGMTLVEAHAAGCKIISTDVGVAREVGAKIISRDYSNVAREILETLK